MEIQRHLLRLAQPDPQARREALEAVLRREGLDYRTQTEEQQTLRPAVNYLLLPECRDPYPLFCAHYDAFPGSSGANDNAAAVCILIDLALELRRQGVPAGFAFFDGEETSHTGAKLFESTRDWELSLVMNLDMCGYGDTLAVHAKGGERRPAAAPFWDKARLSAHGGRRVKYLPEGDECCFPSRRQSVFSAAIVPRWDMQYLGALSDLGSGALGHPPEFEMILGQMEVLTTMHGGFRDDPKWVQPAAMVQMYEYLLDAVTAPPSARHGLFR